MILLFILSVQNIIVFDILLHVYVFYSCACCSAFCNKRLSLNFQCKMTTLFYFIFLVSRYEREVSLSTVLEVYVSNFFACIFEFAHEYLG